MTVSPLPKAGHLTETAALLPKPRYIIHIPEDSDPSKRLFGRTTYGFIASCKTSATAVAFLVVPALMFAGLFAFLGRQVSADGVGSGKVYNSQNMRLLEAVRNPDPETAVGGGDITIVDGVALSPDGSMVPDGIGAKAGSPGEISIYVVREGDTLSQISEMFDVSANTIRWANDLTPKEAIKPGDKLVILPVTGVQHIVKKGETLASIAKKYKGDLAEIAQFNGVQADEALAIGTEVIIPNGEVPVSATNKASSGAKLSYSGPSYEGYYMRPIVGGVKTQGIHGYNGIDIGTSYGAPIYAAAAGEVIISKDGGGWNGGYGNYVVIRHDNGTQTLYAHNSSNAVTVGETVAQGDVVGYVGSTGRSTGSHLHFEVRGAQNPF